MYKKIRNLVIVMLFCGVSIFVGTSIFFSINEAKDSVKQLGDFPLFSESYLKEKGHVEFLEQYFSDISVGYLNEDGSKTIYVFASPIAYLNHHNKWSYIDTQISNIDKTDEMFEKYQYTSKSNNIKPYYPQELEDGIRIQGMIGYNIYFQDAGNCEVSMVEKCNFIDENKSMCQFTEANGDKREICFYPSSCGSNCEILFNEDSEKTYISFDVALDGKAGEYLKIDGGGYVAIYGEGAEENMPLGIIQKPILKDNNGHYYEEGHYEVKKKSPNRYMLTYQSSKKAKAGNKMFLSFELYRASQPDNTLYSGLPDLQYAFMKNYYYLGKKKGYGTGETLTRFKLTQGESYKLEKENILSAKYNVYCLQSDSKDYQIRTVLEDWCSVTGNWNCHYIRGNEVGNVYQNGHLLECDITKLVKEWCDNGGEQYGIALGMSGKKEQWSMVLSNDNTLYNNHTEIILR